MLFGVSSATKAAMSAMRAEMAYRHAMDNYRRSLAYPVRHTGVIADRGFGGGDAKPRSWRLK